MNKKAQLGSFLPYILIGIIVVFVFAIVVIPIAYTGNQVFDELKEPENLGSSNNTITQINKVQNFMIGGFDQLVFFIMIAVFIGLLTLAVFTDFHPIVLGVLILVFILLIILGGMFANVYDEVASTDILASTADEFTFTNLIMGSRLPVIIAVMGIISIIIIFAKRGGQTSPV